MVACPWRTSGATRPETQSSSSSSFSASRIVRFRILQHRRNFPSMYTLCTFDPIKHTISDIVDETFVNDYNIFSARYPKRLPRRFRVTKRKSIIDMSWIRTKQSEHSTDNERARIKRTACYRNIRESERVEGNTRLIFGNFPRFRFLLYRCFTVSKRSMKFWHTLCKIFESEAGRARNLLPAFYEHSGRRETIDRSSLLSFFIFFRSTFDAPVDIMCFARCTAREC